MTVEVAADISTTSLILCALLLLIPALLSLLLNMGIVRSLAVAALRMGIQLAIIGILLEYVFALDNAAVTLLWIAIMIIFAAYSTADSGGLKRRDFLLPITGAFVLATLPIIFYFTILVVRSENILDPRYAIILGGMLMGNSMRGNIIGIERFYSSIRRNKQRYMYTLGLGASLFEAITPHLRESLVTALKPNIATMATMGIVVLPGMMTGQILAGASPTFAIKYQIAIMIGIVAVATLNIFLSIVFTYRRSFTGYGMLRDDIFT